MTENRVDILRKELKNQKIDGFIIPHGDEFRSENLPESSKRLEWLTGFSGSAGTAIVLEDKAVLFVDGRYTLQAPKEVDTKIFEIVNVSDKSPAEWIAENLGKDKVVGYDSWLHTTNEVERFEKACKNAGGSLNSVANAVDAVWNDRPAAPKGKIFEHPLEFSGVQSEYKRRKIASDMKKDKVKAAFISDPSSVAWLLNIRGSDVDFSPLPLSFAVLHSDASVDLLIDKDKVDEKTAEYLGDKVRIVPMDKIDTLMKDLAKGDEDQRIQIDSGSAPSKVLEILRQNQARIKDDADPCQLPKACKNNVEIEGSRKAHIKDGVAVTKFLAWFEEAATKENLTEVDAAQKLESFRALDKDYRGASFETIPATGANGAVVHYHASKEHSSTIKNGDVFLLDSGGQYPFGTTDITRTVIVGSKASDEEKSRYTAVLKGHIALAAARFPEGTTGNQLDVLARKALWDEGLDYAHGTGHGVGSYLEVHEGPQSISPRAGNKTQLKTGMIISNEPGYYEEGNFGIRLENLICVKEPKDAEKTSLKKSYEFETLTLVPFDRNLIKANDLSDQELKWLNDYHNEVQKTLVPLVDEKTAAWLKKATKPIVKKNVKAALTNSQSR
ncbi:MAG: aminopeptidase P family protein [Alphaproteobacteria bacterium]